MARNEMQSYTFFTEGYKNTIRLGPAPATGGAANSAP